MVAKLTRPGLRFLLTNRLRSEAAHLKNKPRFKHMSQKRRNQKGRKLGPPPSTRPGAALRNDAAGQLPAFRHRFLTETCPWIERSTVSFIHVRKDPHTDEHEILDKDRSGVFLRINDVYFILTAAHFIHSGRMPDYVDDEYILGVSWDDDDEDYIFASTT